MDIKKEIEPKPCEKSIFPAISFDLEISYTKYKEAIISVSGWLETDDGKIIGELREEVVTKETQYEIIAKRSLDEKMKEDVYNTKLLALLDRRALNHIEERRMADRKGDVKLTLNLNVKTVRSMAVISHIHEVDPQKIGLKPVEVRTGQGGTTQGNILVYAYDSKYASRTTNMWILSGDGRAVFLATSEQPLEKKVKIHSSDWIHDYAPKLELGEYFIVEIPKGKKVIEEAWDDIEKAEECYRKWDIKGVCDNCRDAGKVLDKAIKEKFGKDSFTYNERWGRTYLHFFNYLVSLGMHLEDLTGKDWEELIKELPKGFPKPKRSGNYSRDEIKGFGRPDAEHILIMTKALIKYAEEL